MGGISTSATDWEEREPWGMLFLMFSQASSSSSVVKVATLPRFLDQWRNISSNKFVLNMVKGHHLELR